MKQLVLIHGALGSGKEFEGISPILSEHFHVHIYEIPGHGNREEALQDFNLEAITADLESYLQQIGKSYVFGFSLGGYLAINLARNNPEHILGIVTLGTKFNWSPEIAQREVVQLNTVFLEEKAPAFFTYLNHLHTNHLQPLLEATGRFMTDLGAQPELTAASVKHLSVPLHITRGGKDKMVTREESITIAEVVNNSSYFEIPSFIHPIGFLKAKHLAQHIIVQVGAFDYKYTSTQLGTIAYKEIGVSIDQDAPVLLFLHEALGSIAQWRNFPEKLSKKLGLRAIVPEMLGYGFSDSLHEQRNNRYLHQFAWEHIPLFIEEFGITNKLLVIGHSDGGTEALLFASKFQEQIAGIVTMAAHIENETETKAGILPAIEAFNEGKLKGLEVYHGERTSDVFNAWSETWLSPSFSDWNITEDVQQCDFPALIIQGEDDQYGTPEQVRQIVNCLGKQAETLIIENCGHSPHLEQQELVIDKIKEWNRQ